MVHIMHFPLFLQKCMSVSSCPCQWSVCQFLHQWNVCQFLPTCASEVYMSISSHMCQWSVCQCLPTCTTEVYVRFFPSVPMTCISVLPTCANEVYVNFFSHVPVKCMIQYKGIFTTNSTVVYDFQNLSVVWTCRF